jgi:hypothetical protein
MYRMMTVSRAMFLKKIGRTSTKLSACFPFFISEVKAEIDNLLVRADKII